MNIYLRGVMALISATAAYFIYIYLPEYVFNLLDSGLDYLTIVTVDIGDFDQLQFYIQKIGLMLIGVTFAQKFAADKSKIKAVWHLCSVFLKIVFWGLFLFVDFNTINLSAILPATVSTIFVDINLQKLFWFTMGAVIFDIILTVFDFLIAFIPEKPKEGK